MEVVAEAVAAVAVAVVEAAAATSEKIAVSIVGMIAGEMTVTLPDVTTAITAEVDAECEAMIAISSIHGTRIRDRWAAATLVARIWAEASAETIWEVILEEEIKVARTRASAII